MSFFSLSFSFALSFFLSRLGLLGWDMEGWGGWRTYMSERRWEILGGMGDSIGV